MKTQVWKILVALLICNSLFAITIGVHYWRIEISPIGGFIYSFILQLWRGIWLYLIAIALFHLIIVILKSNNVYTNMAIGASIGCLLSVCFGIFMQIIDFYDIKGFPIDIIGYTIAGLAYGWLNAKWITKSKQVPAA